MSDMGSGQFQTILVIDSAMNGCGACVYDATRDVAVSKGAAMVRGQAEALIPLVEAVMGGAGIAYDALEAIVTTRGPGAFTGLRIGMSAAKAMGVALGVPVFGVTTLQALAFGFKASGNLLNPFSVILETKRSDFYFQKFDGEGCADGEAVAAPVDELVDQVNTVCIGDAAARFLEEAGGDFEIIQGYDLPDPEVVARAFIERSGDESLFMRSPDPLYLRPADVSYSKKKQRVLAE